MRKNLSSEEILKGIQEDMERACKGLLNKPVTQSLVNNIRYQIDQIFHSISDSRDLGYSEHVGFEIYPDEKNANIMHIRLIPRTERGKELIEEMMKEYE